MGAESHHTSYNKAARKAAQKWLHDIKQSARGLGETHWTTEHVAISFTRLNYRAAGLDGSTKSDADCSKIFMTLIRQIV